MLKQNYIKAFDKSRESTMTNPIHILSVSNITKQEIMQYIAKAEYMKYMSMKKPEILRQRLEGKTLISMFYEPSTRTSCSFQSAMLNLGGNVIPMTDKYSSVEKGESLEDTIKTLNCYGNAIVIRHPAKGSIQQAAAVSNIPIINAGDGNGEHPTQALQDIFTIKTELKKHQIILYDVTREHIYITFVGDLKNSRTIHSLIQILCLFPNICFIFVSPPELKMPDDIVQKLNILGIQQIEKHDLREALEISTIVYMTRIQKERFANEEEYNRIMETNNYIIDEQMMQYASKQMILMHPLPRLNEISISVDNDPRAMYFEQVKNGVYMRMAILDTIIT